MSNEIKWNMKLYGVPNLPLFKNGDDVGEAIYRAATEDGFVFHDGDIIVVTHKIVSKAEGAFASLADIEPSSGAKELADATGRDPRICELYIRESDEILEVRGRMVVTRHRLGFICTCAGIDFSNVSKHDEGIAILLPKDPDGSAARIRKQLKEFVGVDLAVIISDSFGKTDREGSIGVAIGIAGIRYLEQQDHVDLFGNVSRPSIALVDELAGAASIISGEANESLPVVVIRGVSYTRDESATIKNLLI